jgi:class 3 adenylate cyclase/pimeloyl-ACP methyl ester carboxylesterase
MSELPQTRYAKVGDLSIAYQVAGDGPVDLIIVPGLVSHVECFHELPGYSHMIERFTRFARVITFDKRGTGLSDRVADAPTYEDRMDDITAVLDAVGSQRAALFGISEGGPLSALFAVTYPGRTTALVTFGAIARTCVASGYPIVVDRESAKQALDAVAELWGTGAFLETVSASRAGDPDVRALWAKIERLSMSPGGFRALCQIVLDIDVRAVLPSVRMPALVLHAEGDIYPIEAARYFADHIPGARWVELRGVDHYPWFGPMDELLAEIEEFITGTRSAPEVDRVLATVLFTDIVGSTQRAAALGDRRWRELLDAHDAAVRRELARARGREIRTTGDGFFAAFDGPARAIRCAVAIREQARALGIDVRSGLHTGECERRGDDLAGIAVHIGARVAARAQAGEVLVTSTVRDLVAGSGIVFTDRGEHALAGVPDPWRLLAAGGAREARP